VYAVTALHNFLNCYIDPASILEELDGDREEDSNVYMNYSEEQGLGVRTTAEREAARRRRDAVAEEMWEDYRGYRVWYS
jgi:hypothetical protein